MTNIFAVRIEYRGLPYVFCVTDSQATSDMGTKSSDTLKLVQRGQNLVAAAGHQEFIQEVYTALKGTNLGAQDLTTRIMTVTEPIAKQHTSEPQDQTTFFVAGKEDGTFGVYEVNLFSVGDSKRGARPIKGRMYVRGSGASHVYNALQRDIEMGFLADPSSPLEAMLLCFAVGAKADSDLGVNSRLQIGCVSPKLIRRIMPSYIDFGEYYEANEMFSHLTGIPFDFSENVSRQRFNELTQVAEAVGAFYNALETQIVRTLWRDKVCNLEHSKLKDGKTSRKTYHQYLFDRKRELARSKDLVDAFMKGGIKNLVRAVRRFQANENDVLKDALKLAR